MTFSTSKQTVMLPELPAMRELRFALSRGGLRADEQRSPEDWARFAAFRTISSLLFVLEDFRQRLERGERCRVLYRELDRGLGRVVLEIVVSQQ